MRIYGGMEQGGNLGQVAGGNPLLDPRFKIQGGEPWHKPLLPGKETTEYEEKQFTFPIQQSLPAAGIGNVGGLMAQSYPAYGDTINMGPAERDYSNMLVIPDQQEDTYQMNLLMDEFRNRAFPRPQQEYGNPGQYFTQNAPLIGIGGKTVS